MIFEDDAVPRDGFREGVLEALREVPVDYHVLLLGCIICYPTPESDVVSRMFAGLAGRQNTRWVSKHIRVPGF